MFVVEFDRERCAQCLDCVEDCPNLALEQTGQRPFQVFDPPRCTGCGHCRSICPEGAIRISPYHESEEVLWGTPEVFELRTIAQTGQEVIGSCETTRVIPDFEDLVFLPGQLARPPLLSDEPVDASVTIGALRSEKPITVNTPIFIGAMSFGALSREAKIALAMGASFAGSIANTGEGGMLPEEREAADLLTVQYSTGRFGISEKILAQADMVEIKIGQGAKPGLGGHLMHDKVTEEIARVRGVEMGLDLISPSRHPDINSPDDLKERVSFLRDVSGGAPVALKIAAGNIEADLDVAVYAEPDMIAIDCLGGSTGAAPLFVRDNVGVPAIYAVRRADRYLRSQGRREEVTLCISGGLRNASDIAKTLALGADCVYVANSALQAMGCVHCRACWSGRCPIGLATQDPERRARFEIGSGAASLANFLRQSTEQIRVYARVVGKNRVADLSPEDLIALDKEVAEITGLQAAWQGGHNGSGSAGDTPRTVA